MNSEIKKALEAKIKAEEKAKETAKIIKNNKDDTLVGECERKVSAINYYNSLSDIQKEQFNKELQLKSIRENYGNYLKYVYGENYTLTRFHSVLAKLCQSVVEKIEHGEKVKICISVPPQHGKSMTITECLPSWFMGRNPNLRCIITAYNADIAEKFGDRNRQKIKEFGKEVFGIEVSESQDNKTLFDIKGHSGGQYSTGINGSLTSNNGALIIVDDPFKNEIEANNQAIRDMVWSNFTSAVMTRMRGKGNAIIVIHTRWHEDDLIGRLQKCETANEWVFVNIPCVWEKGVDKLLHRGVGETLCPEIGYDFSWANSIMKTIGKRQWNALYQGHPYIESGELVKREYLRFYNKKSKPLVFDDIVLSCDLSFGGLKADNDPCCMSVWGRNGGNHYLLKVINKKLTFTETLERIQFICNEFPTMKKKLIEKKANGNATIETLNNTIGGFVAFDPQAKSKQERLELCLPYFEAGNIYFPEEEVDSSIEELIDQLLRFPKCTHDDFVDTISQYLLNYSYKTNSGRVCTDGFYGTLADVVRGVKI